MKDHRLDGVRRRMGFLNGFNVSSIGRAGGLSLWWDDSVEVQILFSSQHIIDAILRKVEDSNWVRITGVYGTSYREEKAAFWDWMSNYFTLYDILWMCARDFNEFLWDHEKSGGVEVLYNRPSNLVEERIDRALINGLWQDRWPNSLVTHGTVLGSDHCPLIIQSDSESVQGRNAFKFEAFWAKEDECNQLVSSCWNRPDSGEILKTQLVDELRAHEESYWMQQSRVKWLRDGDANTRFFHHSTLQRRRRNQIIKIKDELGNWVKQPCRVRKLVEDHFMQTFTSGGARNWGSLLDCISSMVT
ncbi:uncharacterized protein [Malus domestica]|uniref:uncharacterized protein n=1 Tax=Malus domestica TaxID=3750 RepID=UPI0039762E92